MAHRFFGDFWSLRVHGDPAKNNNMSCRCRRSSRSEGLGFRIFAKLKGTFMIERTRSGKTYVDNMDMVSLDIG